MRDFRAFIEESVDKEEAAGYAGQMARAGVVDNRISEQVNGLPDANFEETPLECMAGLHLAIGIELGLVPRKILSPNVSDDLDLLDLQICSARFLGQHERASEIEAMLILSIKNLSEYFSLERFQTWVVEYAEFVGVKDPNEIPMLRAILDARGIAAHDLQNVEGISTMAMQLEGQRYLAAFRARNMN